MLPSLNELDMKSIDVKNTFLSTLWKEKVYIKVHKELSAEYDKLFIIVRASYGLKSTSVSFREFMEEYFDNLRFQPSKKDIDI